MEPPLLLAWHDGSDDLPRIKVSPSQRHPARHARPITFHYGHWVFHLWPKYIRSKNSCQVLDAHLVDV